MSATSPLGRYAGHKICLAPEHPISLGDIRTLTDCVLSLRGDQRREFNKFLIFPRGLGLPDYYIGRIVECPPLLQKAIIAMRIAEDPQTARGAFDLAKNSGRADQMVLDVKLEERLRNMGPRTRHSDTPSRFLRSVLCHFLPPDQRGYDFSIRYSPGIAGPAVVAGLYPDDIGAQLRSLNEEGRYADVPPNRKVFKNSDGTANLGLGWMPPASEWPILAGKRDITSLFGGVPSDFHVFDPETILDVGSFVAAIQPYGGYQLFFMEDYAAKILGSEDRCFHFERAAAANLEIPVTHDDQKAFATIVLAFFTNTLRYFDTALKQQKIIIQGAGAAGLAAAKFLHAYGVSKEQIYILDSKGLVHMGRADLNPKSEKMKWARQGNEELSDVFKGATFYVGASAANAFEPYLEYFKLMADKIGFLATANPTPEAEPDQIEGLARQHSKRVLMATGRTQDRMVTNNGLVFPNLCAAVAHTCASSLEEEVFLAMAQALANIMAPEGKTQIMKRDGIIIPSYYDERVYAGATLAAAKAIVEAGHGCFPQVPEGRNALEDYRLSLNQKAQTVNENKVRAGRDAGRFNSYLQALRPA